MPKPHHPVPIAEKAGCRSPIGPWGLSVITSPVIFMLIKITPSLLKLPYREETVEMVALLVIFVAHARACWRQRARKGYQDPEGYGYWLLLLLGGFALMAAVAMVLFILILLLSGFAGPV